MSATPATEDQADHLVFVVHGVGDPQPADALTALVDSYCAHAQAKVTGPRITSAMPDSTEVPGAAAFVRTFPVNQVDTVHNVTGERTRFIEVYWGDLSRVKGSAGGLLLGTVDLVFGLRHIVKAARLEIANLATPWWIKGPALLAGKAGSVMLTLIRAPLLALNLFAAIVVALFLMESAISLPLKPDGALARLKAIGTVHAVSGPCAEYLAKPFPEVYAASRLPAEAVYCSSGAPGIAISGVVGAVLGVVMLLMARARGWSIAVAMCLVGVGAIGLGVAVGSMVSDAGTLTYAGFIEDLTGVLSVGAALVGMLVLVMLVASFAAWLSALLASHAHEQALRRALTVVNVCSTLSAALFVLLLMMAWGALSRQIDVALLAKRIEGALHLFILVWLTFLLIGLAYGAIALWAGVKKRAIPTRADGVEFPRYIVGPLAVGVTLVSALAWPLVFLPTMVSFECKDAQGLWSVLHLCSLLGATSSHATAWILDHAQALDGFVSVAVMVSIGAVILLFAARAHFGTALDIVLDVVSHFSLSNPPAQAATAAVRAERPKEHAIWHAIVKRFCVVVEGALDAHSGRRVTVLAHSQGTMIALEGLGAITIERKGGFPATPHRARLPQGSTRINLVTLGCPLTHLYQHYFPLQYKINLLEHSLLQRWVNIFRADDFVGRTVVGRSDQVDVPHNVAVGPRGHLNYWADVEVLNLLTSRDHRLL